jgi:hypothetical protein
MDQKQKVVELYKEGKYLRQIALEVFGTQSIARVLTILKANPQSGYEPDRRRTRRRKYFYNEGFFEAIDDEAKAYYYGLFAADGWTKTINHLHPVAVCFELVADDREILDRLHDILGEQSPPVIVRRPKDYDRDKARLVLHSVKMCHDLMDKGCYKGKSIVMSGLSRWVPEHLHHHFVRGYMDGDGSPTLEKYRMRFSFRGTLEFLQDLQRIVPVETYLGTSQKWPSLYTNKHGEAVKLYEWLYQDATIFLQRKRDKCESGIMR